MLTVRYPNGTTVQYNSATYLSHGQHCWNLYTADPDKGGTWVASIQPSAGAIVERMAPCAVYNKRRMVSGIEEISFDKLSRDIRRLARTIEKRCQS